MRWSLLILLGIFFVSFASAAVPDDCPVSLNPISYWQFEGDADDAYGKYDGTWSGDSDYSPVDVIAFGEAAWFKGTTSITVPDNAEMFNYSFAVEMFVNKKPSGASANATLIRMGKVKIMHMADDTISATVNSVTINSSPSSPLSDGVNYHVALVWSSGGSELMLYVNGVKVDNATLSSKPDRDSAGMIIGKDFVGYIDELAIYAGILVPSIIRSHRDLGLGHKDYCDPSGAAGGSKTKAAFNIQGCSFDVGDGVLFGVGKGKCSVGAYQGEFFCTDYKENLYTNDRPPSFVSAGWEGSLGCAMGDSDWVPGEEFCCPVGQKLFCNESSLGLFQCARNTANCPDFDGDETSCILNNCMYWCDGRCLQNFNDLTCGDYCEDNDSTNNADRDACVADKFGLADHDISADVCSRMVECNGTVFTVNCSCVWIETAANGTQCKTMKHVNDTFDETFEFSCINTDSLGECIDGKQDVSWDTVIDPIRGFNYSDSNIPDDCKSLIGCNTGSDKRFCGEPTIKLPGFSLFALFMSLFVLGIMYIKKSEIS